MNEFPVYHGFSYFVGAVWGIDNLASGSSVFLYCSDPALDIERIRYRERLCERNSTL